MYTIVLTEEQRSLLLALIRAELQVADESSSQELEELEKLVD